MEREVNCEQVTAHVCVRWAAACTRYITVDMESARSILRCIMYFEGKMELEENSGFRMEINSGSPYWILYHLCVCAIFPMLRCDMQCIYMYLLYTVEYVDVIINTADTRRDEMRQDETLRYLHARRVLLTTVHTWMVRWGVLVRNAFARWPSDFSYKIYELGAFVCNPGGKKGKGG